MRPLTAGYQVLQVIRHMPRGSSSFTYRDLMLMTTPPMTEQAARRLAERWWEQGVLRYGPPARPRRYVIGNLELANVQKFRAARKTS